MHAYEPVLPLALFHALTYKDALQTKVPRLPWAVKPLEWYPQFAGSIALGFEADDSGHAEHE